MNNKGPAGKYNNFSQNFDSHSSSNANAQVESVKSLRCVFCNQDKPLDAFSATQIAKATYNPFAPPSWNKKKKTITCKKCTSAPTTHLTCMICLKRMTLEKFAKSQRKNAEKARCMSCIKKREEEDVWGTDDDTDSEEYDDDF